MSSNYPWGADPAVLVVDVTRSLADPAVEGAYPPCVQAAGEIERLLGVARDAGAPVVFTRGGKLYHTSGGVTMTETERGGWRKKTPVRDEDEEMAGRYMEILPAFAPRDDEIVISKHCPSAFFRTMLDVYLSSLGVDTVVVAGMMTSGCIRATVVDAFSHDLHVVLPEGCVADKRPEAHAYHMDEVALKYGHVRPLEEIAAYLSESA